MEDFNLYRKEIEKCVDKFNEASSHARNYKNIITPIIIEKEVIEFTLESENDLGDVPSLKPLWLFSKLLLEVEGLNEYCINNRFLKPLTIKPIGTDYQDVIINNKESIKILLDIYFSDEKLSPYMNELNRQIKLQINNLLKDYLKNKE